VVCLPSTVSSPGEELEWLGLAAGPSRIRSCGELDLVGFAGESRLGHGTVTEASVKAVRNRS
jgi:hypothetical protein